MSMFAFTGAVELGLVYAFVAIGVYLSFRILDFPDLTVDGSFLLGSTVCGVMILCGFNPWFAMFSALIAGMIAGLVTALLNLKFGILNLLASILTMSALYTINLRIMGIMGVSNVNLGLADTALTPFYNLFGLPDMIIRPLFVGILVIIVAFLVWRFLESEIGLAMRATGTNQRMAKAQGIKTALLIYAGMGLSNALVALGGSLYIQTAIATDITGGAGTIVFGLAAVIIGETLFRTRNLLLIIISCIVGSVLYRVAVQFAFEGSNLGIDTSTDLQLITALIVVLTLVLPHYLGAKKHD
ncbi:putative ABC transport system permease protein [Bartonella apihabitans]|uniref:ABC transport system permease protein n=1 Tax=Bartonella apihabitans TaxID=2750929 RepID=A0A1U9MDY5_9HYPH|nr:ABC transporter permease [Bartonella apihabitans]AQT43689.1 putative ABC transport system permease protein [Bartonella apihabitans]